MLIKVKTNIFMAGLRNPLYNCVQKRASATAIAPATGSKNNLV